MGWYCIDGPIPKEDLAVGGRLESSQHHQTGRLARARRPQHGQEFSAIDVQIEVLDDQLFAVVTFLHFIKSHIGFCLICIHILQYFLRFSVTLSARNPTAV